MVRMPLVAAGCCFSTTSAVFGCRLVVMDATSWTKLDNQESNVNTSQNAELPLGGESRMVDAEGLEPPTLSV